MYGHGWFGAATTGMIAVPYTLIHLGRGGWFAGTVNAIAFVLTMAMAAWLLSFVVVALVAAVMRIGRPIKEGVS